MIRVGLGCGKALHSASGTGWELHHGKLNVFKLKKECTYHTGNVLLALFYDVVSVGVTNEQERFSVLRF